MYNTFNLLKILNWKVNQQTSYAVSNQNLK
jgi:hypothetical protein